MEALITIAASALAGYLVNKLERLEQKIDAIELDITVLKLSIPKRKDDHAI